MKDRIIDAISACGFTSAIILFAYWIIDQGSDFDLGSPSGWWWFSCLLLGVFTSELSKY